MKAHYLHSKQKCSKTSRFIHNDTTLLLINQNPKISFQYTSKFCDKFYLGYKGDNSKITAESAIFGYVFLPSPFHLSFSFLFLIILYPKSINQLIAIPYLFTYFVLFCSILIFYFISALNKLNCFDSLSALNDPVPVIFVCMTVLVAKSVTHHFKPVVISALATQPD